MNQLFLKKGKLFVDNVPVPTTDENSVLVKVAYSFISSGTELATINQSEKSILEKFTQNSSQNINKIFGAVKTDGLIGTWSLVKNRLNNISALGYSCSGRVIAVGKNVDKFKIGDYVACAGANVANHAEYVSVPVNLTTKVYDNKNLKVASLTTIGAIAMQGFRRANLNLGEKVVVLGLGLIGQITAQLCKLSGCQVFGIDIDSDRLDIAKKMGIDFVLDAKNNLLDQINFLTNHKGVDATIITASSQDGSIINNAMNYTRRKGRVVLVGDVNLNFSREPFYSKEIDFLISCSYGPGRHDPNYENKGFDYPYSHVRWTENRNMELFVDLVEKKKIKLDFLVNNEFGIHESESAYSYLKKKKGLGALFAFDQNLSTNILDEITQEIDASSYVDFDSGKCSVSDVMRGLKYKAPVGHLQVGFVGIGGFAKIKLLPIVSKNKFVKMHTFVDKDTANLLTTSRIYNVKRITNSSTKVLSDDDLNMVIIATPHKYHFAQSLEALKNGKAVFVEKPAVVNFEQLDLLEKFFKLNENAFYSVDFNRSFAPFNQIIKSALDDRKNPVIINYRMNAGYISKDHWINEKENGGRIIGEACHIFDLFCYLTNSKPKSVVVLPINNSSLDVLNTENFIATVQMSDGSCCSLTYSSMGNMQVEKEYMEILFDGKTILMQDYKTLKGFGLPISFSRSSRYSDKGHEELFNEFVRLAKIEGSKPPISIERILYSTRLTLIVDKLVRNNGGIEYFED